MQCNEIKNLNIKIILKVIMLGLLFQLIPYFLGMGITLALQPSEIVWRTLNQWAGSILWSIICAPILEELIFRKVLYLKLSEKFSENKAMIISSLIFGIIHINPVTIILSAIMGFISCKIYQKLKNIRYSIIFHGTCNFFSTVLIIHINNMIYNLNQINYIMSVVITFALLSLAICLFVIVYNNFFKEKEFTGISQF